MAGADFPKSVFDSTVQSGPSSKTAFIGRPLMSVLALKALVNHSLGKGVTEGYVQMSVERLREPAQRVADKLKSLCGVVTLEGVSKLKR